MARFYRRQNGKSWNWKKILCAVLVVGLLGCIATSVGFAIHDDTDTISPTAFSVGGLDENGRPNKDKQSIYTKNAFECIGLRVEPDFEFTGTYDVFYYDYDGNLVEKKLGLGSRIYDEDFPLAKMARIVIHPAIPEDVDTKDFKINFWEVVGYADDLKISVNEKQEYLYEDSTNLYNAEAAEVGYSLYSMTEKVCNTKSLQEHVGAKATELIPVKDEDGDVMYDKYDVYVKVYVPAKSNLHVVIADSEGTSIKTISKDLVNLTLDAWVKVTIEVPDSVNVDHLRVSMPSDADCYIFGYND